MSELKSRNIEIQTYTSEDIFVSKKPFEVSRNDLVVGDFDWTREALKILKIEMPEPPDYPECLKHLLHRDIFKSTLQAVKDVLPQYQKLFIKPAEDTKAFSGLIVTTDEEDCWMKYLIDEHPADFPVWCSSLVEIISEYRVYIVNGNLKGICHYMGPKEP